jgi:hypothetical protein
MVKLKIYIELVSLRLDYMHGKVISLIKLQIKNIYQGKKIGRKECQEEMKHISCV